MLVIVSWYADGSGQPKVEFQNLRLLVKPTALAFGNIIENIRDTQDKECRIYEVGESDFEMIYDSTGTRKEGE